MAQYTYAIGPWGTGPEWGLDPRGPTFNFYLSGQAHDFSCTIDGQTEAALNVVELAHDLWAWRNGELIFRGPIVNLGDTGDANEHTVSLTANSYRYRLARLYTNLNDALGSGSYSVGAGNGPANAWSLISGHLGGSSAQSQTDLFGRLVKGTFFTPTASTFSGAVNTGTNIASSVDSLAQVQYFDWDILPNATTGNLEFTAWQPGRGSAKPDVAFVYIRGNPGTNCTFERTFDVSQYANRVYVNGQNTSGTQWIKSAQADYGSVGRYTAIEDGSDLDTGQLQARANTLLTLYQEPAPSYTITPNEGVWLGPDSLWLGDQPTLMIRAGRLSDVLTTLSINQITLSPADGNDNFSFSAGGLAFGQHGEKALARGLRDMSERIRALEWTKVSIGA